MRQLKETSRTFAQPGFKPGSTIAPGHDDSSRENLLAFDLASGVLESDSMAQHAYKRPFPDFFKRVYAGTVKTAS